MLLRLVGRRLPSRAQYPGRLLWDLRAVRKAGAHAAFSRTSAVYRNLVRSLFEDCCADVAVAKSGRVGWIRLRPYGADRNSASMTDDPEGEQEARATERGFTPRAVEGISK
jgi:hypothetical protein